MKQGYNARLDESLGAKHGKKSQSYKARRDESAAMSKKNLWTQVWWRPLNGIRISWRKSKCA